MRTIAFGVLITSIGCSMIGCIAAVVDWESFSHIDWMLTVMSFAIGMGALLIVTEKT
tara:strand:+ start:56 stop:226 length:171 start_codon:yes stop_codon:yes gene_type:complete